MTIKLPKRWPYWPPNKVRQTNLSRVYRPPGYVLLSEATDHFGREHFEDEWTGNELLSRKWTNPDFPPPSKLEDSVLFLADELGVQCVGGPPFRWRVMTTRGQRFAKSKEHAVEIWHQERPKLVEMYRREHDARRRFDFAVREIREALNVGNLVGWLHRTQHGDLIEIPRHVWAREGADRVFVLADDKIRWTNPNEFELVTSDGTYGSPTPQRGRVVIRQAELEAWLSGERPNTEYRPNDFVPVGGPGPDHTTGSDSPDLKRAKGGRPPLPWEDFYVEIAVRADLDGLPEIQAQLVSEMAEWCAEHWGREPSESTLKAKISPIYNHPRRHKAEN